MNKQVLKALVLTVHWIGLLSLQATGQVLSPTDYHSNIKSVQTPNAASLGRYGDMPVNFFTGTPNIDIPLTHISNGPIDVPISLSYHAGGVQVNERPGWAGLGWSVICGGQITRKVCGIQDEYYNLNYNVISNPEFNDKGFFFTGSQLDNNNWNTTAFMRSKLNAYQGSSTSIYTGLIMDGEPDEFQFSFGNYSGSFYRSEKGEWKVKSKQNITLEIEHEIANFGSYRLYELFNPITDGDQDYNPIHSEIVGTLFTKFTITTPDGFKYTFGGDTAAVEFSRGMRLAQLANPNVESNENYITANSWFLTKIIAPTGDSVNFRYKRGRVLFQKSKTYTPGFSDPPNQGSPLQKIIATATNPCYLQAVETPLKRIEFVNSFATELGISTGDLSSPLQWKELITANYNDLFYAYGLPGNNQEWLQNFNRQLDSIKIFDKTDNQYRFGFKLYHRAEASKRRTLDSLSTFTYNAAQKIGTYKFSYSHVDDLPAHETLLRDHYGFYNGGTEPLLGTTDFHDRTPSSYALYGLITKIIYPTGGETRFEFEPADYSNAIKFDPANASSPIQLLTESGIAGPRIKKIIDKANYNAPEIVKEYFYRKNYAGGGLTSSGVLGIKLPYGPNGYFDRIQYSADWGQSGPFSDPNCQDTFTAVNYYDNSSEWLGMVKGGIVTYSEVTEKKPDGSFTVYNYANSDQAQYRDEIHDNYTFADHTNDYSGFLSINILQSSNFRISSNDLERGNILTRKDYNNNSLLVKSVAYEYVNDVNRKSNFIKAIAHKELYTTKMCGSQSPGLIPRGWAYKVYCYNNPVKSVTETLYESSGPVANTVIYAYDQYGNTVSTETNTSDGNRMVNTTKYNSHADYQSLATGTTAVGLRKLFTDYKIKNYPVEQLTFTVPNLSGPSGALLGAGKITAGSVSIFDQDKPLIKKVYSLELNEPFLPVTYSTPTTPVYHFDFSKIENGNFIFDSRYQLQTAVNAYTSYPSGIIPRPLSTTAKLDNVAYTWDYFTQYQTSVTQNALATEVAFTGFEGSYTTSGVQDDNKGNWNFNNAYIVANSFTGEKSLDLTGGSISSVNTLASGKPFYVSFWAMGYGGFQLKLGATILNQTYAAIKTVGNWNFYRVKVVGNGGQLTILQNGGAGTSLLVDELRLYPAGSLMASYNYDPMNGQVTSINDQKDIVTFYKYDLMGRLVSATDENGNLLSKQTYQIQGAQ